MTVTYKSTKPVWVTWKPGEIRALRSYLGWTLREFGYAIGVHPRTVGKWEAGDAPPTTQSLILITALANANGWWKALQQADD